jgi:outer membrane protein insertion porin family
MEAEHGEHHRHPVEHRLCLCQHQSGAAGRSRVSRSRTHFFIEPGKRVYVRRIDFKGNTQTKDEVLRREMRQFEGAWFSQLALDRSRLRIQRLGFFDNVNIETVPVDGSDDQVDIMVSVEEQPSGSFQVGLGYSQFQGIIASIAVEQDNFLGSGRRVGFSVQRSRILTQAGQLHQPYWTDDGVSRGFFLRYSEFDTLGNRSNIANFSTSQAAGGVNFGFPGYRAGLPALWCLGPAGRNQPAGGLFPGQSLDEDSRMVVRIPHPSRPAAGHFTGPGWQRLPVAP